MDEGPRNRSLEERRGERSEPAAPLAPAEFSPFGEVLEAPADIEPPPRASRKNIVIFAVAGICIVLMIVGAFSGIFQLFLGGLVGLFLSILFGMAIANAMSSRGPNVYPR